MNKYKNEVQKYVNKHLKKRNKGRGTERYEYKQMGEFGRRDAKLKSIKLPTQGGKGKGKGKAVPLQAWSCPEGSRKLR
jgi:hypothetical protein